MALIRGKLYSDEYELSVGVRVEIGGVAPGQWAGACEFMDGQPFPGRALPRLWLRLEDGRIGVVSVHQLDKALSGRPLGHFHGVAG